MNPKTPISDEQLEALESEIRKQYRDRIDEKGTTPEGLFWDSKESMQTRFDAAIEFAEFERADVLDVGCGFGDFYGHLQDVGVEPATYHGIDVSDAVLDEAINRYGDNPDVSFERRNVLRDTYESNQFDIAVVFGALGHNLESIDNEAYIRRFLRTCFTCADTVVINALSQYRQGDWDYEEFVYYYDPGKVFSYAQELTRNVRLRHDFEPNPQKEFIIVLEEDKTENNEPSIAQLNN
jgi:SAM-dependent methyltransferase